MKIFADGADRETLLRYAKDPLIQGFTTNPTLMRRAGVTDYEAFARAILGDVTGKPISFEVFADEEAAMERQARKIASWGPNVYVKIPVTNTRCESTAGLVRRLSQEGVQLNITAVLTLDQVRTVANSLDGGAACCVSVFAGRIADTGLDPLPIMRAALEVLAPNPKAELIWASPREVLNVFQADQIGCHIITATVDILARLPLAGKDLGEYSLETVRMFHHDAAASGFTL